MQYNLEQRNAIERIVQFAQTEFPEPFSVVGPGGSGKTTCVMDAVRQVLELGGNVLLCAPTNKAVTVLQETAKAAGLGGHAGIGFSTLHKALGLALLPTSETRQIKKNGEGFLHEYDVIIIDECSMLSRRVIEDVLLTEITAYGHRVMFMGDEKQVFPVRERESLVFSLFDQQRLSRVERFGSESDIAVITNELREAIELNRPYTRELYQSESLDYLPDKFFKQEVVKVFSDHSVDPLKDARVMAWRNSTVDKYNRLIRAGRYGEHADPYVEGEMVLAGSSIGDKEAAFAHVDQPLKVIHVERNRPYAWDADLPDDIYIVDKVTAQTESGETRILNVITDEGRDQFEEELNRRMMIAKRSDDRRAWPEYYRFLESFDSLKYPYCTTVHKAQGSTYDCAYVDVRDITSSGNRPERLRLLYVACSRPRKKLILNNRIIRA